MKNNDHTVLSQTSGLSTNNVIKNLFSLLAFKYQKQEVKYIRRHEEVEVVRNFDEQENSDKS